MKTTAAADSVIDRDGITSDNTYKIVFNAKMAKILSDGLYSDKIKSIIRELSSNAYDSHIAAGNKDPFEVHLPNQFEPWFSIRDFGVGLNHDEVLQVYTVYGASTKTESNDYVGQLGLGSKSPFSYVDAFDVTAIKDGIARQFSMYKNEQGMPSVALLGETATKEHNGVTVKIPVTINDFRSFYDRAYSVYNWYETKPKIVGANLAPFKKMDAVFEGKGWKILSQNQFGHRGNESIALMGRVGYPLDPSALTTLTEGERALMNMPLVLEFNIGDLEVSASRESLGYDPRTQGNIKALLGQILTELSKEFEKRMANAKTEWDARKEFNLIFNSNYNLKHYLINVFGKHGLKWKNNIVITSGNIDVNLNSIWDSKVVSSPTMYSLAPGQKRCRQFSYGNITITCDDKTVFIIDDLDKGVLSRAQYYNETTGLSEKIYIIGPSTLKKADEIIKLFGNPPTIKASILPKRPTVGGRNKVTMLEFDDIYGRTPTKIWKGLDMDISKGGIYVILDHWDIIGPKGQKIGNFSELVTLSRSAKILDISKKIYAPRGKMKDTLKNEPGWVNFWDYLKDQITAKATTTVIQSFIDSTHHSESIIPSYNLSHPWKKVPGSVMVEYVGAMEKLAMSAKTGAIYQDLVRLAQELDIKLITNGKPTVDAKALRGKLLTIYPMLQYVFDGYHSYRNSNTTARDTLVEYVEMVDKYQNSKP